MTEFVQWDYFKEKNECRKCGYTVSGTTRLQGSSSIECPQCKQTELLEKQNEILRKNSQNDHSQSVSYTHAPSSSDDDGSSFKVVASFIVLLSLPWSFLFPHKYELLSGWLGVASILILGKFFPKLRLSDGNRFYLWILIGLGVIVTISCFSN